MSAKKDFKGALATPIEARNFEPGMIYGHGKERDARIKELKEHALLEDFSKLKLLCDRYGIEDDEFLFMELSLALARELVPGFREKTKRGRKTKWTDVPIAALIIAMERLIVPGKTEKGATWAAVQLAKVEPWKSFLESKVVGDTDGNPAESLRKKYHDYRDSANAKTVREAFAPAAKKEKRFQQVASGPVAKLAHAAWGEDGGTGETFGRNSYLRYVVNKFLAN